jgi:perosamine synthetase
MDHLAPTSKKVPIPLARPLIGDEERQAVDRVLRSGMIAQGPEVAAFEDEFSEHVSGRHCIAVNSGTSALHLALVAMGIGRGDEVIVPSFSFAASANAVVLAGAQPVFADVEPDTFTLDVAHAANLISERTAAIMPVHLYGHPAAMTELCNLASERGIGVIEDAAQAHLASLSGTPVGAFGTTACFSFYPTKNMTTGEGGMVTTADPAIARKLRLLRNQGMEQRYQNEIVGFNVRMTDIAGAIGRVQLQKLPEWTRQRRSNADHLSEVLRSVVAPVTRPGATHVFHQYTVRSRDRDSLLDHLQAQGIGCGVYYPTPIHELPSFAMTIELPNTRLAAAQVISLPIHPTLTTDDLDRIAQAAESFT